MKSKITFTILSLLYISGCNLANHGSFVTQSFHAEGGDTNAVSLGLVQGESCQTSLLYFIPYGESASTKNAISDAKTQIEGTQFLADITIDDEFWFEFGYSVQCISVAASAFGHKLESH